jgi:hypothetical protein
MIPSDILVLDKNRNIKNAFLITILVICLQCQMGHYWFPRQYLLGEEEILNVIFFMDHT